RETRVLCTETFQHGALALRLLRADKVTESLLRLGNRHLHARDLGFDKDQTILHLLTLDGIHAATAAAAFGRFCRRRGDYGNIGGKWIRDSSFAAQVVLIVPGIHMYSAAFD